MELAPRRELNGTMGVYIYPGSIVPSILNLSRWVGVKRQNAGGDKGSTPLGMTTIDLWMEDACHYNGVAHSSVQLFSPSTNSSFRINSNFPLREKNGRTRISIGEFISRENDEEVSRKCFCKSFCVLYYSLLCISGYIDKVGFFDRLFFRCYFVGKEGYVKLEKWFGRFQKARGRERRGKKDGEEREW